MKKNIVKKILDNLLDKLDITIEDNKISSSWKFKDQ